MADDSDQIGQDEIEKLLAQSQGDAGGAAPEAKSESSGGSDTIDQSEIEALMAGAAPSAPAATSQPAAASPARSGPVDPHVSPSDIELLLSKAEQALDSIDQPESQAVLPPGIRTFDFERFGGAAANSESATLELVGDVQLDMTIELGRTHMQLEELLKLKRGAVVALDKLAGDPADIYVNGRLVARGEVLVLNDNFCIRVAELIEGENAVA